ncbi:hypothetical protein K0M31_005631 [Melipona bicolor]|uniref:Uncharacterized protein n=1 Tax=Melipona bicolor TaxID=60889 RepID=A0AA40FTZ2_9HYME|nr:hypothetical protein K0M31_005631 [Melipona bicolor]
MRPTGRAAMEMTLRWLGRPDLAKYVRENPRLIKLFGTDGHDVADTLEFPRHGVSRRHTPEMDKNSYAGGKTKKKKATKKKKKKRTKHRGSSKAQNKGVKRAMIVAAAHPASHIRNENKKDKNTFTDSLEWNDEGVCSCSGIEEDCTGKCEMCDQSYQTRYVTDHRIGTDDSIKSLTSVRKPKKEEKKKLRLGFLQRGCQNRKKEKDQNNRDRKCVKRRNFGTIEFEDRQYASRSFVQIVLFKIT